MGVNFVTSSVALPIPMWVYDLLKVVIVIVIAIILDRIILRRITKLAIIHGFSKQTVKSIMFFIRFVIVAGVFIALTTVTIVPPEYFAGVGALMGAAIGFASARAFSDFVSGAYIMLSGVIRIGDYIRIDSQEGIVVDMSVSYTKIRRDDGSIFIISNKTLSGKAIINFRVERNGKTYYIYPLKIKIDVSKYNEVLKRISEEAQRLQENNVKVSAYIGHISKSDVELVILIETKVSEMIPSTKKQILSKII